MTGALILSLFFGGIVLVTLLTYPFRVYNKFVFLSNNNDKAFANIDVWLKQRSDELPGLCSIVAAYADHEKVTIEKITQLREEYAFAHDTPGKVVSNNLLTIMLHSLKVRLESTPNISSDSLYQKISERITRLDGQIADQRTFFNDAITIYNIEIQRIPQSWFARLFRFKSQPLLDETDR